MHNTNIDWCKFTVNPIKGLCKNDCWYCSSKLIYKRFYRDTNISFKEDVFSKLYHVRKSTVVYVNSTHDTFGEWIPDEWIDKIIYHCTKISNHAFVFFTKNPKRYRDFKFPNNCWLGMKIAGDEDIKELNKKMNYFLPLNYLKVIKYEPLLYVDSRYTKYMQFVDWVIVGSFRRIIPKTEYVNKILDASVKYDTPVFIKKSVRWNKIIQEYPRGVL